MRSSTLTRSRPLRLLHAAAMILAASLAAMSSLCAQSSTLGDSPAQDMISRAKDALNKLQYEDAIRDAKLALQQPRLRTEQRVAALQTVAAAYFPNPQDGDAYISADSAERYLTSAVRLRPDLPLAVDIRWPGLDSLFRDVRERTFSVIALPDEESSLVGSEGRSYIQVVSTRPASFRMLTTPRGSERYHLHDSVSMTDRARLGLRAHDGETAMLSVGEHMLLIEVTDGATQQRDTLRFSVSANGDPAPLLRREPNAAELGLLPERRPRKFAAGIASAVFFGGATVALAQYARAGKSISSARSADGRARVIGIAIAAGALAGGLADEGVPLPNNVAENTMRRAQHALALQEIRDVNRRAVSEYRLAIRISPEAP